MAYITIRNIHSTLIDPLHLISIQLINKDINNIDKLNKDNYENSLLEIKNLSNALMEYQIFPIKKIKL